VNNKIFDAIVCDASGEIKVVAFNDQVDRLYELFIINKVIVKKKKNGKRKSKISDNNYRKWKCENGKCQFSYTFLNA
jgi:hypothetical protein